MPQNVAINLPIPSRLNPGLAAARERHLEWMRRQGLVVGHTAARRYLFSAVADLAAYSYPDATGEDLDLAFDTMGWFFLFDDLFDVPEGCEADEAVDVCRQLIALVGDGTRPHPDGEPPLVAAFADIWRRTRAGMSEEWRQRAAHNWVDYLVGNLTEEIDRRTWVPQDFATRMRIGHRTLGLVPSLDLAERLGHFEIPPLVWHSSHLDSMRRAAVDAVKLINEIKSLENDDARRLHEQARMIPLFSSRLGLTGAQSEKLHRYATAMLTWIRGSYDWSRSNGRYSPHTANALSPDESGQLHPTNLAPVSR